MTEQEFTDKQASMLADVPEAFRGWMSHKAWESGHACGYEEVLNHLSDLTDGFEEALAEYDTGKKSE